ncbi:RidA family protein [Aliikangiella sp. IMCC44359]|uniref:RidA family protein n=1 Tax=Aliikangiella sp. IMCC44359 TaxID=3459125 RepID=UPI00403ACC94
MVDKVTYTGLPDIAGPYVHAAKHDNTLYVSGLTAFGTEQQKGTLKSQCEAILNQINIILESELRGIQDIIKVTMFVKNIEQLAELRVVLFKYYQEHLPASSLVEVSNLFHPDLDIEIEAIIALK